jgi:hypothetical protein
VEPTELGDGTGSSTDGGTFFATLDGRVEDGISPDSVIAPGEDIVEKDLARIFGLEDLEAQAGEIPAADKEDVRVLWELRKKMGDEDFNAIFEDPRISGDPTHRRRDRTAKSAKERINDVRKYL